MTQRVPGNTTKRVCRLLALQSLPRKMINHNCALCWFFKTDSSFSWVIILQVHFVSFSEKSHLSFFKSFSRFGFPSDPKEAFIILQVMFSVKFWHFLSLSFCKSSLFFPVSVYHFPGSFCQNFHQPHVQKIQTQQTPLKNPLKNLKQGKDNNDRHKTARRQLYCNFLLFSGLQGRQCQT